MRPTSFLLGLLAVIGGAFAETPVKPAQELDGLWSAHRDFGPAVRGELWLEQREGILLAQIAGRSTIATAQGDNVRFQLPADEGEFRGRFSEGRARIEGHWIQPVSRMTARRMASPVTLERQGKAVWRGEVAPLDDRMTLHLVLRTDPEGTTQAFLRNPERNVGIYLRLTRLVRQGDDLVLVGRRSKDAPESEMLRGRYDAENGILSLYMPDEGGHYDFMRATTADEREFYPRGRQPERYEYRTPPARDDGWPVGTLDEVGIDRAGITGLIQKIIDTPIDSLSAPAIHGVLIARHGRLVLEEYFHGFGRDRPHDTRSAAKTVSSVLAGAAIWAGAPFGPATRVYEQLGIRNPDDPRKARMTVEHLLTMSSGYDCDERAPNAPGAEERMQEQTDQPDWWRYTLDVPMAMEPGTKAYYCGSNPNLVGAVMVRATGEWLPDLFHDRLAAPLGIERYYMNLMPSGDPYLGGGMYIEPRDFMKLGQLAVGKGRWLNRQVVSPEWMEGSTSALVKVDKRDYGYFWWIQDYPYRGRTVRAAFVGGNGGQIVMAIPELDLVVAFYGGNYNDRATFIPQNVLVPEYILPAVR